MDKLRALWLFTVSAVGLVHAQSSSGTFLGSVRDASGAAIAGATVSIVNQDTGFRREIASGNDGEFELPFIPLGNYTVGCRAKGFKSVDRTGVNLQVDQKARIDFTLNVGELAETITVTEAAPLVKASSSEFGEVVQQRAVQELPLNGRNYVQLVHLTAGVTTGQQGGKCAGINRHVVGDARALRKRSSDSIPTSSPAWCAARCTAKRGQRHRWAGRLSPDN